MVAYLLRYYQTEGEWQRHLDKETVHEGSMHDLVGPM